MGSCITWYCTRPCIDKGRSSIQLRLTNSWTIHGWLSVVRMLEKVNRVITGMVRNSKWNDQLLDHETSSNGNIFRITGPLIYSRTNAWANNRDAGDLRHHRAHYNVTVIQYHRCKCHGFLRSQVISSHDIDYVGWMNLCLPWARISTTYALLMSWNAMHIKFYVFS